MADDITNKQLLHVLTTRFDSLEKLVVGIGDTLAGIADNMATGSELEEFCEEFRINLDNTELRLGRRIDAAFLGKTAH